MGLSGADVPGRHMLTNMLGNVDALWHCGSQAARVRFWLRAAAVFGAAYTSFLLSVLFICAVLLFRYHIGTFHLFRILWLASLLVSLLSFWCGKIFFVRWNYYIIKNFQKSQLSFVAETSPKCAKRCETFSNVTWNAEYLIFVNDLDLKFACLNIL